jgi:hypothetical protein
VARATICRQLEDAQRERQALGPPPRAKMG